MNEFQKRFRSKPARFRQDDLGGLEMVCYGKGGGGSKVEYTSSPEERALLGKLMPVMDFIYPGGKPATDLYDVPGYKIPQAPTAQAAKTANLERYTVGGDQFNSVYNKISPALWQAYENNIQDPLVNRFAGSGSLGSPVAGLSGAAADVLEDSRRKAGNDISAQAYNLAQTPLLQAMQAKNQAKLTQQQAQNLMNQMRYQGRITRNKDEWMGAQQEAQYPYQILPGMLGGTMPQPVVTQKGGKK